MAQTYRSRHLAIMRANEQRMAALFAGLASDISGEIARHADAEGKVPQAAAYELQQAVGARVQRFFLGRGPGDRWAPYSTLPDGSLLPLSPYMRALWEAITAAVRVPVEQHAEIMARRLPVDLAAALGAARPGLRRVREQGPSPFRPNPLARYDPPHTWVDPNGYRLSDRVWRTAGDTRRRLDAFLDERIRAGDGALRMSRQLEQFLLPGRTLRTRRPYGTDASYDAMRLARTEITRAAAQAAEVAAQANPFVQGLKWNLSASHPKYDICDLNAADGPYTLDNAPMLPAHPQCMCYWTYVMIDNPQAVLDQFRAEVRRARSALIDIVAPLAVERFVRLLLGQGLETLKAEVA